MQRKHSVARWSFGSPPHQNTEQESGERADLSSVKQKPNVPFWFYCIGEWKTQSLHACWEAPEESKLDAFEAGIL